MNSIEKSNEHNFSHRSYRVQLADKFILSHFKVGNGYATVGGTLRDDKFYFSVSLCSPEDNFSRAHGRDNVWTHMVTSNCSRKRGVLVGADFVLEDTKSHAILLRALLKFLDQTKQLPGWTKNATVEFRSKKYKEQKSE